MRPIARTLLCAVLLLCALPAHAAREEIDVPADQDWEHQWTAMEFPAKLLEFNRQTVVQFQPNQSDISANYVDGAGNILSLYIYRPSLADAAIWHDRALVAIGAHDVMFGSEGVQGKRSATFAPRGSEVESGLLTVLTSKGAFRSTGIAIYSAGDWLAKVRLSSRGLDPEGLEALLRTVLGKLPKLEGYSEKEAYLIEACFTSMRFTTAERFKPDDSQEATTQEDSSGDLIGSAALGKAAQVPSGPYCREGEGGREGSLYRSPGVQHSYILAFGDSGTSAIIGPAKQLDEIFGEGSAQSSANPYFSVSYATATQRFVFMPYKSLPEPNQAAQAIFGEPPIATVERPLGD